MIEEALYSSLSTDAGLLAFVGTRIYPTIASVATDDDYIAYQEIGRGERGSFDVRADQSRFRFYVFSGHHAESPNYSRCKQIVKALRTAMTGIQGVIGDVCVAGVAFDTQSDTWDEPSLKHGVEADFIITFKEA